MHGESNSAVQNIYGCYGYPSTHRTYPYYTRPNSSFAYTAIAIYMLGPKQMSSNNPAAYIIND